MSGLPGSSAHSTLIFFVYGQWGRHRTELIRGLCPSSPEYYELLNYVFRPYYSRLPSYEATSPDCVPVAFLATDWQNDKFAGYGSYCNFPVGVSDGARDVATMREGMPDSGIWFAGEHTAPVAGLGTVTGAYWSGEAVAERTVSFYKGRRLIS